MGWLEAQERYHQGKTLTEQSVEDLVARRVLRGLGIVQKDLPRVERAIFGDADFNEAIWPRTLKLMKYAFISEGRGGYADSHVFECYETDSGHKAIMERLSEVPLDEILVPVFLTRVKDSKTSVTYSLWDKDAPELANILVPPFNVIAVMPHESAWLVVQETEGFIRQFMRGGFQAQAERALDA